MRFSRSPKPWLGLFAVSPIALGLTYRAATPPSPAPTSSAAYSKGLLFWRKSGRVESGAACANCHGPDALELASYGFDDADILRRARVHLSDEDSQEVVNFIHSVRDRYGITTLLDPMRDRPFQPGGEVLPGDTPNARDLAFGQELEERVPMLFNGRIEDMSQAKAAAKAMLDLDPWTLKVGIPLDRLSEDVAHGVEHAVIDQWLPETPPSISDQDRTAWFAAEDEYLAEPSIPSLRKLIALHEKLTFAPVEGIRSISNVKYRALLLLDYRLRTKNLKGPQPPVADEVVLPGFPNPVWEVGAQARDLETSTQQTLGMSTELAGQKSGVLSNQDQMGNLSVSWFWLGWMFDQGMQRSLGGKAVRLGEWFSRALWLHGPYPIHNIYSSTRLQLVASFTKGASLASPERHHLQWDYAGIRLAQRYRKMIPTEPIQKKLYLTFAANCFRMNLFLLEDELKRTHVVWMRPNNLQNVQDLTSFIEMADPDAKAGAEQKKAELDALINSAEERF